jgi:hypothetical protein
MAIYWWKAVQMKIVFIRIGFKNPKIARIVLIAPNANFVTNAIIVKNVTTLVFYNTVRPVTTRGF